MKLTLAFAMKTAEERGWELALIDGIPEGFSYRKPDVTIGDKFHKGFYMAFIPFSDGKEILAPTEEKLLELYKLATK